MTRTKVQSELIATNAISGTIIADGAITSTHLAANCVDSSELVTGSIDTIHIAANQVTATKIVTNGVLTRHISDDQVTAAKLANSINTDIATGPAALPKAGGTMSGSLNMGSQTITNAGTIASDTIEINTNANSNTHGLNITNSALSGAGSLKIAIAASNGSYSSGATLNDIVMRNETSGGSIIIAAPDSVQIGVGGSDNQTRFTVDSSGNVGIGVTSSYPLTVQSGTAGSNHAIALRNNSTNNLARLGFLQQDSATLAYTSIDGDGRSTGSLRFNTNDTERMRISADGYMQMGTAIGNSNYNAKFNIVDNAGTNSLIKLRNGTGNKSIQFYGDNNVEYGFIGLDTHSGAANLLLGSADNQAIRMQSGGMQIELTDGSTGTSSVDTGSISISNTDLDANTEYNIRAGRYLQSNGTGWENGSDGKNPALVIHNDNSQTNNRNWPGIIMHNENNTEDAYGPSLSWGAKSTSTSYNTSYAWIMGRPTGNGPDNNWKAGELELYTQGTAYVADKPGIRITQGGLVQKPRQYDANGFFWARSTSNPSNVTGTAGVVFTVAQQAGSGNYSTSTGRYTTPVEGIYHFDTQIRIDGASNTTSYFRLAFYTGTSADPSQTGYGQGHVIFGPGTYSQNYFSMSSGWTVHLAAGVQVGVAVRYEAGSYSIHSESNFSGFLVG